MKGAGFIYQVVEVMLLGAASLPSIDLHHSVVTSSQYSYSFASILPACNIEQGVSDITTAITPQLTKLLSGGHLTYLLYHSLASRASEVFCGHSEDVLQGDSMSEKDGLCVTVLSNVLSVIKQNDGWSLCLSVWSVCDGCVYDMLSDRAKRQMIDSGTIIFGRGIKSYRVCNKNDIRSVLHVAMKNRGNGWKDAIVCVGQIINYEGQFVGTYYDSDVGGSYFTCSPTTM